MALLARAVLSIAGSLAFRAMRLPSKPILAIGLGTFAVTLSTWLVIFFQASTSPLLVPGEANRSAHVYLLFAAVLTAIFVSAGLVLSVVVARLQASEVAMRQLAMEMKYQAETDSLTGLENRRSFWNSIEAFFQSDEVASDSLALIALDLSNFGRVNDSLGQIAGDALLRLVAHRLRAVAGERTRVARVGGDEFCLLIEGGGALLRAQSLVRAIIESFEVAFGLRGCSYSMKISVGVAGNSDLSSTASELWRDSNRAMLSAKRESRKTGDSHAQVYSASMAEEFELDERDFNALLRGMDRDEMTAEYSPVFSMDKGDIVAFRSRLVWYRQNEGKCTSEVFFPLAARHDLLYRIGTREIDEAYRQIEFSPLKNSVPVFVSVRAAVVMQGDLSHFIDYMARSESFCAERLWLGIEELAMLIGNEQALVTLHQVKERGVKLFAANITGDDWSTSVIRSLPISAVEISAEFFASAKTDHVSHSMLVGILSCCAELNVATVVGGIDHPDQIKLLKGYEGIWVYGTQFSESRTALDSHLSGRVRAYGS